MDIEAISNELELTVNGVPASAVIAAAPQELGLMAEINERDVVEMNISMAPDVAALNRLVPRRLDALRRLVDDAGGILYGGGAVLDDISTLEPARKRTTALSDTLARGFLAINSHQVILGMAEEAAGLRAYEALRIVTPFLLAVSAATPYVVEGDRLIDTGMESVRPARYRAMMARLPPSMWRDSPSYRSIAEFEAHRRRISDEVNVALAGGRLDVHPSLWRLGYAPFDLLEPHQLYQPVRVRTDHGNIASGGRSIFSLEVRLPDMAHGVEGIALVNRLVYGVALAAEQEGLLPLHRALRLGATPNGELHDVALEAGRRGIEGAYLTGSFRRLLPGLVAYAAQGLRHGGYASEAMLLEEGMERRYSDGSASAAFRRAAPRTPDGARRFLADRLAASLEAAR